MKLIKFLEKLINKSSYCQVEGCGCLLLFIVIILGIGFSLGAYVALKP